MNQSFQTPKHRLHSPPNNSLKLQTWEANLCSLNSSLPHEYCTPQSMLSLQGAHSSTLMLEEHPHQTQIERSAAMALLTSLQQTQVSPVSPVVATRQSREVKRSCTTRTPIKLHDQKHGGNCPMDKSRPQRRTQQRCLSLGNLNEYSALRLKEVDGPLLSLYMCLRSTLCV